MRLPLLSGLYWLAVILVSAELAYSASWAVFDVASRMGVDVSPWIGSDAARTLPTLSIWQESVFLLALASVSLATYFLWTCNRLAIPAYLAAIAFSKLDWVILGLSGVEHISSEGYVSLIFQAVVVLLILAVFGRGGDLPCGAAGR